MARKPHGIVPKVAVIYVGYPKSGKDTQTEPLEALGEKVLVTGRHLKSLAKKHPHDERYKPILVGELVNDPTTEWATKLWIYEMITMHPDHTRLHLNGVPRRWGQMGVITFLIERGYIIKVIWFTTPPSVCDQRIRAGRFEDENPDIVQNRARVYAEETIPMRARFNELGINIENGNLLEIDNTDLTREETAAQIIDFAGLPFKPHDMFPAAQSASKNASVQHSNSITLSPP